LTTARADVRLTASLPASDASTSDGADKELVQASAPPRREVLNAMRALREMPPFAREREIEQGRYSYFSPEEREMLRNAEK